jgi:hypothetical protein
MERSTAWHADLPPELVALILARGGHRAIAANRHLYAIFAKHVRSDTALYSDMLKHALFDARNVSMADAMDALSVVAYVPEAVACNIASWLISITPQTELARSRFPMAYAYERGFDDLLDLLLRHGWDPWLIIESAARNGPAARIRRIMRFVGRERSILAHLVRMSASGGNAEGVDCFAELGAPVGTALAWAVERDRLTAVRTLLRGRSWSERDKLSVVCEHAIARDSPGASTAVQTLMEVGTSECRRALQQMYQETRGVPWQSTDGPA